MRWLIACVLAVFSSISTAEGPVYAELQLGGAMISNGDLDFYPVFASVNAGVFLMPGIGIELFADSGLSTDSSDGFEMDLQQAYGIAARFQSPPYDGLQGYIVLGAVNYSLEQTATSGGTTVDGDFTGMRASVGFLQRLKSLPQVQVGIEYRHYNADEPLKVDALMLGLRVNAP